MLTRLLFSFGLVRDGFKKILLPINITTVYYHFTGRRLQPTNDFRVPNLIGCRRVGTRDLQVDTSRGRPRDYVCSPTKIVCWRIQKSRLLISFPKLVEHQIVSFFPYCSSNFGQRSSDFCPWVAHEGTLVKNRRGFSLSCLPSSKSNSSVSQASVCFSC